VARHSEGATIQRELAFESTTRRQGHVALHSGGGRIVVERDQLGNDFRRRPSPNDGITRPGIGIDDDNAVLSPQRPGEQQHQRSNEQSHEWFRREKWVDYTSTSALFSTPSRRMRR
jgi:hypothetical protein